MGDAKRDRKADEIFLEVIDLPPADRSRFLEELSSSVDASILREVKELLSVDQRVADKTLDGNPHVNVAKYIPPRLKRQLAQKRSVARLARINFCSNSVRAAWGWSTWPIKSTQ